MTTRRRSASLSCRSTGALPRALFHVLFWALPWAPAWAQTGPWIDHVVSNDFDSSYISELADLDGDGDLDFVSASRDADEVAWFENDGAGGGWTETLVGSGVDAPFALEVADLDGDGDRDVVSASSTQDELVWFANLSGDGSSWAARTISLSSDAPFSIDSADVDGDGDVDLVVAELGANQVTWYENVAGNGSTWTARAVNVLSLMPVHAECVDLDSDGDVDVVSLGAQQLRFHENLNGDGSVWQDLTVGFVQGGDHAVCGDVDGDGDPDVVTGSVDVNTMLWFENLNGDASAWSQRTIATSVLDPLGVGVGDVDLDGDLDVTAALFSGGVEVYRNADELGTSWARQVLTESVLQPTFAEFGDVDLDGDLDVASSTNAEDRLTWHENRLGQGPFWARRTVRSQFDRNVEGLAAFDVDGDGDLDGVAAIDALGSGSEGVFWYENADGDGRTWNELPIQSNVLQPRGLLAADLDGDGDTDVLVTSFESDQLQWYENPPDPSVEWTVRSIASLGTAAAALGVGDVDGDGDLDVLSDDLDDDLLWHANLDGLGASWSERTIAPIGVTLQGLAPGDFDGDGDLDVCAASGDVVPLAWYRNVQGTGNTWSPVAVSATISFPEDVAAADLDGDGTLDLAVVTQLDDALRVFRNPSGTGNAWTEVLVPSAMLDPLAVRLGDVDGDGANDIVTTSEEDDGLRVFHNTNGGGVLWDERVVTNDGRRPRAPSLGDADGDGDVDLWIGSGDDANVRLFLQPLALRPIGPVGAGTLGLRAGSDRVVPGAPLELLLDGSRIGAATHALVELTLADRAPGGALRSLSSLQPLAWPRGAGAGGDRALEFALPPEAALAGRRVELRIVLVGAGVEPISSARWALPESATDPR